MENPFITLVVLLALFVLFREVICWYWKLNTILEILKKIDAKLESIMSQVPSVEHSEKSFKNGNDRDYS